MEKQTVDVLIVGSGAAGLAAAAASQGLETILIEKSSVLGGTTARSGGTLWIPGNSVPKHSKIKDSIPQGRAYLDAALGPALDSNPESSSARRDAFLKNGPTMLKHFTDRGFKCAISSIPDYRPELPGAMLQGGRTIDPSIFDAASLGPWYAHLSCAPKGSPVVFRYQDFRFLTRPCASLRDFVTVSWLAVKSKVVNIVKTAPVSMGCSLVAQLLSIALKQDNVHIYREAELVEFIMDGDAVVGGIVQYGDSRVEVRARRGVVLASAGFAQNQKLRDIHLQKENDVEWSLTPTGADTGNVFEAARSIGAATSLLDQVWGVPVLRDPVSGGMTFASFQVSKPHSIVVNSMGDRYFSEAAPYGDAVKIMYEKGHAYSWLIVDKRYRRRYTVGGLNPWTSSKGAREAGRMYKAGSISELAQKIKIDPSNLERTVTRWNQMCQGGKDLDFQKGDDIYQRYIGDTNVKPNSTMGTIEVGPFYAIKILPGDAGTKGGLVTDEHARVLRSDSSVVKGLYAAGNTAATLMGSYSLAAGVTLSPAMVFSYLAMSHMANQTPEAA